MGLGVTGAARSDLIEKANVDLVVTTFLKAMMSRAAPTPILIDGQPCLLVQGDVGALVLLFEIRPHLIQFLESVEQARRGGERGSQIDPGVVHGPCGVIAMPPGARIDEQWRTLKAGIYDGQVAAVRRSAGTWIQP